MPCSRRGVGLVCLAAACLAAACENPVEIGDGWDGLVIVPPPATPENLVSALEVVYNDKVRSAAERLELYANLFAPQFVFHYWAAEGDTLIERTWGLDEELAGTRCLFQRQDAGGIYSLTLAMGEREVREPDGGYPAGWKEVRAGRVYLRLLVNPDDGMELAGGASRFICAPSGGRWFIMDWFDPAEPTRASTWAQIKRCPSSEHR